jgi:hypothetical protein
MFKTHPEADARKRSAVALVRYLLADQRNPDVLPTHRRELIRSVLLYKISEAECCSKFKTRFQSEAAWKCNRTTTELRHDHVYQRSKMIMELEKAEPEQIDDILNKVIGCTITKQEHDHLTTFDKECDGWVRYQKAEIVVIDTKTDEPLTWPV